MRIRYCPKCDKAGLKWQDTTGKGYDGRTDNERYQAYQQGLNVYASDIMRMRYCPRCKEWVNPELSHNFDQHKRR